MEYLQVRDGARTRAVVESISRESDDYWTVDWTLYSSLDEICAAGTATVAGFDYGGMGFRTPVEDDLSEGARETLCDTIWLAWLRATRTHKADTRRKLDAMRRDRSALYGR